jgi:acyl-CoA thioester hydrolase
MKPIVSATAEATPQFYDLDPMSIVWHGHYPKFLELGRVALMAHIAYGYREMVESGFAWPVIDLRMRYARPMTLGKPVTILAGIVEWENLLRISYLIRETHTGERIMRASTSQAAVEIATGAMQWVTPPALRERLSPFLPRQA